MEVTIRSQCQMIHNIQSNFEVHSAAVPGNAKAFHLKLVGELSGDGIPVLRKAVDPVFISPAPPVLRLLMDGVSYMDSSGVGVIISIIRRLREINGRLEIVGLSDVGRELFNILRLADLDEVVILDSNVT